MPLNKETTESRVGSPATHQVVSLEAHQVVSPATHQGQSILQKLEAGEDVDYMAMKRAMPGLFNRLISSMQQKGQCVMFNRSAIEKEATWDSQVYTIAGHGITVVPVAVGTSLILNNELAFYNDEVRDYVPTWAVVPYGYDTFAEPLSDEDEARIADPLKYIDLRGEYGRVPLEPGKKERFVLVKKRPVPPRTSVRPLARDMVVMSQGGMS